MKNKFEIMKQIEKLSHEDKLEIKDWLYGIIINENNKKFNTAIKGIVE